MLPLRLEQLKERLKAPLARTGRTLVAAPGWLAPALPDGGFPIGITELSSPRALGCGTLIASQVIALALKAEPDTACAWVDPERSLYAPGLLQQGVELPRLIVVQPPRERLRAVAVRIARAGAVTVLAIDFHPVGGKQPPAAVAQDDRWARRLQLACEEGSTAALLFTDARVRLSAPLPVALKLGLNRLSASRLEVTVLKERSGRSGQVNEVELP